MHLPPPREPFPVKIPFITATDMYKLGKPLHDMPEDTLFLFDNTFERMIAEKLTVFREYPEEALLYLKDDLENLETVLWQLAESLTAEQPDYFSCDSAGLTSKLLGFSLSREGDLSFNMENAAFAELGAQCHEHLQTLNGMDRLCVALSLSVQEDLVIMRNLSGEPNADVAEALLVALPTHWIPREKLGLSFGEIHQPIGDNKRLLNAAPRLMKAMINSGPFVRYNWSLASVRNLCQNPVFLAGHSLEDPDLSAQADPRQLLDLLYFRVERQTLLNFTEHKRALFAIRIYQRPLLNALKTDEHVQQVADAVASMSPAILAYRSMGRFIDTLIEGLRAYKHEDGAS